MEQNMFKQKRPCCIPLSELGHSSNIKVFRERGFDEIIPMMSS